MGFITEYVEGTSSNVHPDPGFKPQGYFLKAENLEPQKSELFKELEVYSNPRNLLSYLAHMLKTGDFLKR